GWADRAAAVRSQGMSPIADGAESRWFTPEFIRTRGDVVATLVTDLRNCDAEGYAACCDALAVADLREQIAGIEASTLIIAGSQDPVTTPADSDFMAARIPNAERIDLPASHLSNIEAADGFTEAVSAFLMK